MTHAGPVVDDVLQRLSELRVVPVVSLDTPAAAAEVAVALAAGGLPIAEVTLRRPGAELALAAMARDPAMTVGAGTVLSPDQVDVAVDCGAAFVVSPGLDERVVGRAVERGVLAIPGVATATEIQRAVRAGAAVVKLFPAGPLGGPPLVAALSAPFPGVSFVPTGGIGAADLGDYLALRSVLAVGGSWLTPAAWVRERRWDDVTEAARAACAVAAGRAHG